MKKTFAILLALVMSLSLLTACGGSGAAEPAAPQPSASEPEPGPAPAEGVGEAAEPELGERLADFYGNWQDETSQRAVMSIAPAASYGDAEVQINWGSGAQAMTVWTICAAHDEAARSLYYANGEMAQITWADDGTDSTEILYNDGEGAFNFNEDGTLTWVDKKENAGEGSRFVRITPEVPSTDDYVNGYFKVIGGYAAGTSGSTLAQAKALYEAFRFADLNDFLGQETQPMRDAMLTAWESMTDEERAAFDANFIDVVRLGDACMENFEDVRGAFDDAGVGEEMAALLNSAYASACWRTLADHTLTMGNDPG